MASGPLVVCADDYGLSPATSRIIRELIVRRALNATTCLVETDGWLEDGASLRLLAMEQPGLAVGLHLNLTEALPHCARPDAIQPVPWWLTRTLFHDGARVRAAARHAFAAQWDRFVTAMGREPDFLDGHQYVHLYAPAREALLQLARTRRFGGWVRQCRTSSARPMSQRILYDPMSDRLRGRAQAMGLPVNPGFGGLRWFRPEEDIRGIWRTDCAAMTRGGVLVVHPGGAGSPRGSEGIDALREEEATLIAQGELTKILQTAGQALADNARSGVWPPAGRASVASRP